MFLLQVKLCGNQLINMLRIICRIYHLDKGKVDQSWRRGDLLNLELQEQWGSGLTQRTLELIPYRKDEKEALKIIQLGGFPYININNVSLSHNLLSLISGHILPEIIFLTQFYNFAVDSGLIH